MTYSILLLGTTTSLGQKIAKYLARRGQDFTRVAALTLAVDGDETPGSKSAASSAELRPVAGPATDPKSYQGFDVVVFALEDQFCAAQKEYVDAAIAGGVKHFYPSEYGPDLDHPLVREDPHFATKISVRRHLETHVPAHGLGYTYLMIGVQADVLIEANILGLSADRTSATHFGHPDAKVSTTHSDDVAQAVVTSLLPQHLGELDSRRHIRLSGSTLPICALYDAMSYILHQPIAVAYQRLDELDMMDRPKKGYDSQRAHELASLRRVLGAGGFELRASGFAKPNVVTIDNGQEHMDLDPKSWTEVVHAYFPGGRDKLETKKRE